ncbi:hypothetical protein BH10BDE1_BH10BDE1_35660 [soil metagenome]
MSSNLSESIFDAASVNDFLRRELDGRLGGNQRYSMRAFARHLGMSPGELSEVLREKRPISARACQKVARALSLSPAEFKHLLVLATTTGAAAARAGESVPLRTNLAVAQAHRLDEDRFRLVSDWWCFAILNLLDLEEVRWTGAELAERFGITILQAQSTMERLERLGLVKKNGFERAVATNEFVEHLTEVSSEAIRRYHRSLLEKAIEALDTHHRDERDVTGIGFAVDRRELKSIAREIAEFQDQLIAKYGRKRRGRKFDSVYQLETALFRLSPVEKI